MTVLSVGNKTGGLLRQRFRLEGVRDEEGVRVGLRGPNREAAEVGVCVKLGEGGEHVLLVGVAILEGDLLWRVGVNGWPSVVEPVWGDGGRGG